MSKEKLILKFKEWYKDTEHSWKVSVIDKCIKENILYIDKNEDIDFLYNECIDYLFHNSKRRILNLATKLGYKNPPCNHCVNIIKYWDKSEEYMWSPDNAHLFKP